MHINDGSASVDADLSDEVSLVEMKCWVKQQSFYENLAGKFIFISCVELRPLSP